MILRIYTSFRIFLFVFFLSISIYSSEFYEGSKIIFLTYCLSLIYMVYYLTNKNSSFIEIFLSAYIFLGFWFKYIFSLIFFEGKVYDSGEVNASNIDDVLAIGIIIVNAINFSSWISRKLIDRNISNNLNINRSFFENFYLNNRVKVLISFFLIICLVSLINTQFNIYQRGFISLNDINHIFVNLIKLLLLFGLSTFSCFLIHIEITRNNNIGFFTFLIASFEIFFSYSSMLSRSSIISMLSIVLPSYMMSLNLKKSYNKFFCFFLLLSIIFAIFSIYLVNSIRLNKLDYIKQDWKILNQNNPSLKDKNTDISNYQFEIQIENNNINEEINNNENNHKVTPINMFQFIIINRWIGIDSLILVHNSNKTGFSLLIEALKENKHHIDNTFYEKTFGLTQKKINIETLSLSLKGNTLPGIITFLYYSGNVYFVALSLIVLILLFNFFEKFIRTKTNNNLIFTCVISQMISTRLMHFGYAPKDSYLFFSSIVLSVIFIIFLYNFHFDLFKKNKI